MELLSPDFFSALLAIIVIDLVLAGDNAIVIALAARNVPPHLQKRTILCGTAGAIAVRAALTLVAVWLLGIPGLMLTGGLALIWIALRLLHSDESDGEHKTTAANSFWGALRTIIIADAVMGVDNVLAVAGAAHGSFALVLIGLVISVPIVVWGSTLVLRLMQRFPAIIYVGAGVLAWTAVKMITGEALIAEYVADHRAVLVLLHVLVIGGVLGFGYWRNRRAVRNRPDGRYVRISDTSK
jgi:YjbE family integral membrane protein